MHNDLLKELLVDQVRDIYDAEKQLLKALPKLAKASHSEELGDAIRQHWDETQMQTERLETIFQLLEISPKGKTCKAMKGLIAEGNEAVDLQEGILRDLAMIAAAQRVEHYEISAYGTARTIAERFGNKQIAGLLQETEDEEKAADSKLTQIAETLYDSQPQTEMASAL